MWDFLPVNLNEIKQIEVIRGPASAVWGANAVNGVVNVHHQVAARDAGHERARSASALFDRSVNDNDADGGIARLLQRHARAGDQRSLGVQAVGRRLLAGSAAAADRRRFPGSPGTTLSGLRQHRHDPAEVRRAARLRLRGRPQAVVLGRLRRHRRHHALGHRPVRHQQRLDDGLRQGELQPAGAARRLLHQRARRQRRRTC